MQAFCHLPFSTFGSLLSPSFFSCRRMVDCKIKKKMMKKPKEKKVCVKGKGEECFNVIKLEKRMEEKKTCSFHPKTVCHPSRMKECRRVKKKMCNYLDSNRL